MPRQKPELYNIEGTTGVIPEEFLRALTNGLLLALEESGQELP